MDVTLWTTVFGDYHRFLDGWMEAAAQTNPDRLMVVSDRPLNIEADVIVRQPNSRYPYTSMLNYGAEACEDGWVWRIDVDDRIMADALSVLHGRDCDVVMVGIVSTKDSVYIPSVVPHEQFLAGKNRYISGSPFTKETWVRAGGFPDIAHCDWGFWRRCAKLNARFEAAGRVCYLYRDERESSLMGEYADPKHDAEAMAE